MQERECWEPGLLTAPSSQRRPESILMALPGLLPVGLSPRGSTKCTSMSVSKTTPPVPGATPTLALPARGRGGCVVPFPLSNHLFRLSFVIAGANPTLSLPSP